MAVGTIVYVYIRHRAILLENRGGSARGLDAGELDSGFWILDGREGERSCVQSCESKQIGPVLSVTRGHVPEDAMRPSSPPSTLFCHGQHVVIYFAAGPLHKFE
ncbi:hypothetical protein J3458_001275 [Metarhizium acridum]|uniref:uncharacterized protein n=1 Tax=Metarhizium acridum TaxID=92637 RepID=UPI001C6D250D|nr:hypothetical protein J3458_001275 [Metarhizium acridum]